MGPAPASVGWDQSTGEREASAAMLGVPAALPTHVLPLLWVLHASSIDRLA